MATTGEQPGGRQHERAQETVRAPARPSQRPERSGASGSATAMERSSRRGLLRTALGVAAATAASGALLGPGLGIAQADGAGADATTGTVTHGLTRFLMTPVRALDTRGAGNGLLPSGTLTIKLAGVNGVPANATGIIGNLAAVPKSAGAGTLVVYPADIPQPATSTINYLYTEVAIANAIVSRLSPSTSTSPGSLTIANVSAIVSCDVLLDVVGWIS